MRQGTSRYISATKKAQKCIKISGNRTGKLDSAGTRSEFFCPIAKIKLFEQFSDGDNAASRHEYTTDRI
jgi:hypothetical protein